MPGGRTPGPQAERQRRHENLPGDLDWNGRPAPYAASDPLPAHMARRGKRLAEIPCARQGRDSPPRSPSDSLRYPMPPQRRGHPGCRSEDWREGRLAGSCGPVATVPARREPENPRSPGGTGESGLS
jgi:hypothetical protein